MVLMSEAGGIGQGQTIPPASLNTYNSIGQKVWY